MNERRTARIKRTENKEKREKEDYEIDRIQLINYLKMSFGELEVFLVDAKGLKDTDLIGILYFLISFFFFVKS